MNIGKPLFWHQGLFLQPQHFQYTDALHLAAAHALAAVTHPHHWGVAELELDEGRLAAGVLEITRASLLFADGTLVAVPQNAVVAPRDFRAAWDGRREPMTVYLGVKRSGADANVSVVPSLEAAAEADTRYASLANADNVADLYQGGSATTPLKTLSYVLRLFLDTELAAAEHYELVPIARLEADGEEIRPDPHYAPPSLSVGAAPTLLRLLREVRDDVIGRAHQLEEYKSGGGGGATTEFSAKLMRYRMALQVLARYASLLAHWADAPLVHPWQVYGLLRQLVGEVSVFSSQADILGAVRGDDGLPAYDHLRAGESFLAARKLVERLLNEITLGPETLITLNRAEDGRFFAELPRDFLDRRGSLYLVLRTEDNFEELLDGFHSFAKLGAGEQVEVYARRALPGLSVTFLRVRPESLPHRPNASYFRVNRNEAAWEAVETERSVALLWDDAPADLKAELVLVRG